LASTQRLARSTTMAMGWPGLTTSPKLPTFLAMTPSMGLVTQVWASFRLALAGLPVAVGMPAAMVVAGVVGAALAFTVLRLTGDYFGIATLAFGEMMRLLFINVRWLTRGPMGIPGIPRPSLLEEGPADLFQYMLLTLAATVLVFLVLYRLETSPFGRALKVVREDEYVAQAFGKSLLSLKVRCVIVGSAIAGLAGALWAHYVTYISPNDFTLQGTIIVLLCVVLGGKGSPWGPLVGALLVVLFQESLRFLPIPADLGRYVAPLQGMLFGLILVLLMLKRPAGLIAEFRREQVA
ncbi:MAG: branched-chain amino acid ABC transporter permease, partial [Desulfoferrobacter sp.]